MTLRADDRVLILAIPSYQELGRMAAELTNGLLVAIGTAEEVDAARASLTGLENVMFLNARPDSIPWRESYFTKIVVPAHLQSMLRSASGEFHRLLAQGGEIVLDRQDC